MEGLFELFFAPVVAFFEALAGLICAVATIVGEIVGFFFELLLLALFKGITPAKQRFREGPRKASREPGPVMTVICSIGFVIFVAVGLTFLIRSGIEHSRTVTTQDQVDALADAYIAQLENKEGDLVPGPSGHHDAWDNAIVLQENDFVVGTQVVVRSNGPDGQPNSDDDIAAVRYHKTNAKEIRDHLVDKAVGKFEKFFAKEAEENQNQAELELQEQVPNANELAEHEAADAPLPAEPDAEAQDEKKQGWRLPAIKFGWGKSKEEVP